MALTRRDLKNAKELRRLVEVIRDLKDHLKRAKPMKLPRIGLDVDPVWVKQNAREAAKTMESLRDALMLAITYADAAKQPHARYKLARPMLIEAMSRPR